ncbi:hypothetical protein METBISCDRAFT_21456 [Metschnikowia bicuspidata]|uniref:WSC domain-containing protein n=1 Tax=Metschnikowia bicuspidata TaxID=27322 RepID=A0A4P9ZJ08_9ASCO|nr:hypothetical protein METBISCDRAFT_21456 [Metschnikowia bicuspidata]
MLPWFLICLVVPGVAILKAIFSDVGCYLQSDIQLLLTLKGDYLYQSISYCQELCGLSYVAALLNGKSCYCGLTAPLSALKKDSSKCNMPCHGFPKENCGGDGYFQVYINGATTGSSQVASTSSSSATTTSSSLGSSSTSQRTSSTGDGGNNKISGLVTTSVYTTTFNGLTDSVIEVTTTISGSSSSSSKPTSLQSSSPPTSNSMNGGQIAGAVVGSIAGVLIIGALAYFFWRNNKNDDLDDVHFFDIGKKDARMRGFDSVIPNNYLENLGGVDGVAAAGHHTHSTSDTSHSYSSNPEALHYAGDRDELPTLREENFGRRRLSDGSLPDMVARGPGSLKVVN